MYHIKNDKRSKHSAKLIAEGFIKLLKTTCFEDVTITAICDAAGAGRSTFYRIFDDKADVLIYSMDVAFEGSKDAFPRELNTDDLQQHVYQYLFTYWLNEKDLIQSLIDANLYYLFQKAFAKYIYLNFSHAKEIIGLNEREWVYFSQLNAAMFSTALSVAINSDSNEETADISDALAKLCGYKREYCAALSIILQVK